MPEVSTTLEELAKEAAGYFTTKERGDETIIVTRDGSPDWIRDVIYAAHGDGFLPDDWRYATISAAVDHLADGGDPDDGHEFADQNVDVYTGARLAWLSSNLNRAGYVDEAREELGGDDLGVIEQIGLGQYQESLEVFGSVVESLRDRLEEIEDDE